MKLDTRTLLACALALTPIVGCGGETEDTMTGLPTETSGDGDPGDGDPGDGDPGDGDPGDGDPGDGDPGDGDPGDGDPGDGDPGGDPTIEAFCDTACNDCFMGATPWKSMPADQCVSECVADFDDCDQADIPEILMCTGGDGCPAGALDFGFCLAPFTCLL